jgi:hypothetical protein
MTNSQLPLDCYVILHVRGGHPWPDPDKTPAIAATDPFQLSEDIWIERFDKDFAGNIQKACEPANHGIHNDVRDRHLYAFVRKEPEAERQAQRLPGVVVRDRGIIPLFVVLALSRLVRPTTTGYRYCAKIYPAPPTDPAIQALVITGSNPDVMIGDLAQDWLSPKDGLELRDLMPWVSSTKEMLPRVNRAFWNHDEAMHTYVLDSRLPMVVGGIEALIQVDGSNLKRRFARRARQLATEFGVDLSESKLFQAYGLRSELVHAASFLYNSSGSLPKTEHRSLYEKLELLLRLAVKKCLLDPDFAQRFASNEAIEANYPYP